MLEFCHLASLSSSTDADVDYGRLVDAQKGAKSRVFEIEKAKARKKKKPKRRGVVIFYVVVAQFECRVHARRVPFLQTNRR